MVLEGVQITFMYCSRPRTRSVRAIIVCAFNPHITGLLTCGPRTTSSAVFSWHSDCESAVEQIRITMEKPDIAAPRVCAAPVECELGSPPCRTWTPQRETRAQSP